MRVVTVLKSGGDFKPLHVQVLARQVKQHAPFSQFQCLSDVEIEGVETIPLLHKLPGWWSKIELFRPDIKGDFLFMDLDTVIVGPLDEFEKVRGLTVLRDFYRDGKKLKEGLQSSLMHIPDGTGRDVWDNFMVHPALTMARHRYGGDQQLLERYWLNTAARWQDVLPGQVVSWKVNCTTGVPPEAKIVIMHGKPRPWSVGQFLHLYR